MFGAGATAGHKLLPITGIGAQAAQDHPLSGRLSSMYSIVLVLISAHFTKLYKIRRNFF
jgi:hypothetical protein